MNIEERFKIGLNNAGILANRQLVLQISLFTVIALGLLWWDSVDLLENSFWNFDEDNRSGALSLHSSSATVEESTAVEIPFVKAKTDVNSAYPYVVFIACFLMMLNQTLNSHRKHIELELDSLLKKGKLSAQAHWYLKPPSIWNYNLFVLRTERDVLLITFVSLSVLLVPLFVGAMLFRAALISFNGIFEYGLLTLGLAFYLLSIYTSVNRDLTPRSTD